MSVAFTFPGQGSQAVGMGKELADSYPEARAVFDEVDEALGEKLSDIMWNGPEETLTLTANAQPALMAVSLAAMRVLEAKGLDMKSRIAFVAGHSLGEYSALAAAGTFSISDTARLLRTRGSAMQAAVPVGAGAMAAIIGLEQDAVERACAEAGRNAVCQVANDNGGGQFVISGDKAAVEHAARICSEAGAKRAIMLPVSAPFHSAMMAPAADAMRMALDAVEKHPPIVPLVSNVTVTATDDPEVIVARLVEQVTGRVRWRETVEFLTGQGVATLYEIGSGKVLSGLARRIDRNLITAAVSGPTDIDNALAVLG